MRQIKLFGLGGQGVVTAAKVFAEAVVVGEGRFAQSIPAYGHERRGAPVYSDLIVGDEGIKLKSFVYNPDYVVIFDMAVLDKGVDVMAGTNPKTIFIVNSSAIAEDMVFAKHKVWYVDALPIALECIKRDIPNTTMLGAMAAAGLTRLDCVEQAIGKSFAGSANIQAAKRGHDELKQYR